MLNEIMIAWTPVGFENKITNGGVKIGRWPDNTGWSNKYLMTTGACYSGRHKMEKHELEKMMFIDFHTMVVRDGIDPKISHEEFLKIPEYRKLIAPDIDGAE